MSRKELEQMIEDRLGGMIWDGIFGSAYQPGQKVRRKSNGTEMTVRYIVDEDNAKDTNDQPGHIRCSWSQEGGPIFTRTFAPDEIEPIP
jgi:hypothetical protein